MSAMKRSPMRRNTPGALAWARRPGGAAGRRQRALWQQERDEHLALFPACQFVGWLFDRAGDAPEAVLEATRSSTSRCEGRVDVHHIVPRGMGGRRGPAGPKATLCRRHHDWVELHRRVARAIGLLIRRTR